MKTFRLIQAIGFVCIASTLTAPVQADYVRPTSEDSAPQGVTISTAPRYFQPRNPSAPEAPSTPTGTRRGGCFDGEMAPQVFAPNRFVGLTASAQPQIAWSLPNDEPVPMEFSLYALQQNDYELKHLQTLAYEPGINLYQLPMDVELEPGTRYLWQLVLRCYPNRPSSDIVYQAEMEYVPMVAGTMPALGAPAVEQSETYAKAGYWYDAISVLGSGQQADVSEMRTALLQDLKLLEEADGL